MMSCVCLLVGVFYVFCRESIPVRSSSSHLCGVLADWGWVLMRIHVDLRETGWRSIVVRIICCMEQQTVGSDLI